MKKSNLIKLGFERVDVSVEESGGDPFFYYTLDICKGLSFISISYDNIVGGNWKVELFNTDKPIVFDDYDELKLIISILKKNLQN